MRILAIERELTTQVYTSPQDLLRDEATGVWELQKKGIIRDIWFTADRHGIIMLECTGAAEAREHLDSLPLVRHGMSEFILHELRSYDGFERLFATGAGPPLPVHEEPPEY